MTQLTPVQFGTSGLRVSPLCLGTMNFGEPGKGHQGDWTLGLDTARPIFQSAIEHGIFYFDTADMYGFGASEEVVGALLRELLPRDQYVLATKLSFPDGPGGELGRSLAQARDGGDRREPQHGSASITSTTS